MKRAVFMARIVALALGLLALPLVTRAQVLPAIAGSGACHASVDGDPTSSLNCTGATAIFVVTNNGSGSAGSPPVDSQSNTYVQVPGFFGSPGYTANWLWVAWSPTVTSSMTFSGCSGCTQTTGYPFSVAGFTNVASGPDQTSNTVGNGGTINITPSHNYELLLGISTIDGGCSTQPTMSGMTAIGYANSNSPPAGRVLCTAMLWATQTTATTLNSSFASPDSVPNGTILSFYGVSAPATLTMTNTLLPEGYAGVAYGNGLGPQTACMTVTGGCSLTPSPRLGRHCPAR
jgi:hypothetical protein